MRTRTLFKLVATHWKVKVRLRAISQAHSSLPPGAINWSVLHTLAEAPARLADLLPADYVGRIAHRRLPGTMRRPIRIYLSPAATGVGKGTRPVGTVDAARSQCTA